MAEQRKPRRRGGRNFYSRPKVCKFCGDKSIVIDYKDISLMRNYVTEDGKIRARRQTGTCAKHQRKVAVAVKRARHIAFLPFTGDQMR